MTLTKTKYEIYPYSEKQHALIVKNARLAKKINSALNYYYPENTQFELNAEPLFKFDNSKLPLIKTLLRIKE
jgi:hypothetical protein